jgi:hypothetical protein
MFIYITRSTPTVYARLFCPLVGVTLERGGKPYTSYYARKSAFLVHFPWQSNVPVLEYFLFYGGTAFLGAGTNISSNPLAQLHAKVGILAQR